MLRPKPLPRKEGTLKMAEFKAGVLVGLLLGVVLLAIVLAVCEQLRSSDEQDERAGLLDK